MPYFPIPAEVVPVQPAFRKRVVLLVALSASGCSSLTAPADELMLEIAETRVPCIGVAPKECLFVRQNGEWQFFYDAIQGFHYEPGYRYRVVVARSEVRNPPADGSSYRYRLKSVTARERSARFDLVARLRAAEAKWEQARPASYVMVEERGCFCTPDGRGPVRIEATRLDHGMPAHYERVVSMRYVSDNRAVSYELGQYFFTAQGLFGFARLAVARNVHRIDIEFDDTLGYPRRVYVDGSAGIADDEVDYVVHSLVGSN